MTGEGCRRKFGSHVSRLSGSVQVAACAFTLLLFTLFFCLGSLVGARLGGGGSRRPVDVCLFLLASVRALSGSFVVRSLI